MDELQYKKLNKFPACTSAPWASLIPKDQRDAVMRAIRNESLDLYGYAFDECPKRLVCLGQRCIGRSLPWLSATAKPYLDKFAKFHNIKEGEDYYIKTCEDCAIVKSCTKPCHQINDYLQRTKQQEPELVIKETIDNIPNEEIVQDNVVPLFKEALAIPWDCLTSVKQQVVKLYLYGNRDFKYVADTLQLNNQANAKYIFYSSLNRLSEFAVMRKFIMDNSVELNYNQLEVLNSVYNENLSLTDVANKLAVSKQAIEQTLSRIIKNNNISWTRFVKKVNKKTVYNVPKILKD